MEVDFGVEVVRDFEASGEVTQSETPAGEVVTTVHVGHYDRIGETHDAVRAWATAHQRTFAGMSWEIYGHWHEGPDKLETKVEYLLG